MIKELKLGKQKATKDGIELTPKQQEGIQAWAKEKGYGGIRYETDFKKAPDTTDEIIIFDTNNANRFVDSDAAVAPVPKDSTPTRPLIDQAIETADDFVAQKLPEQVIKDINEGRADYGENWVMWEGKIYFRRNGMIDGPNGRWPEGHKNHPWEAEAIQAEKQ